MGSCFSLSKKEKKEEERSRFISSSSSSLLLVEEVDKGLSGTRNSIVETIDNSSEYIYENQELNFLYIGRTISP